MKNYKVIFKDNKSTIIKADNLSIDYKINAVIFYVNISECETSICGLLNINEIKSVFVI